MKEYTLSIIKPDAVKRNLIGKINSVIENNDLKIVAMKMIHLSRDDASNFYQIHSARPFFNDLINFMSSGPVVVQVLEGENAVNRYREIMGSTNPKDALPNTIRALYANNIEENAVHGSDSLENAQTEIAHFFNSSQIYGN